MVIIGGVYKPEPVTVEPDLAIYSWMVNELPNGDRHLVGNIRNGHDGRVTSKIMDYAANVITTRSGRRYYLCGPAAAGLSVNADYVWKMWCRYNHIDPDSATDVSDEYKASEVQ